MKILEEAFAKTQPPTNPGPDEKGNCRCGCGKTVKQINDELVAKNKKLDKELMVGLPVVLAISVGFVIGMTAMGLI